MRVALVLLAAALMGAAFGWQSAPRWEPPGDEPEARLRQRAAEHYRAGKRIDYRTITQTFSPPYQLAQTELLLEEGEFRAGQFERMAAETQADLQAQADSIKPDELSVRIEGNWALTSGVSRLIDEGQAITIPLEELVWVRDGAEWWVFSFTTEELNAYGNPPDFALHLKIPTQQALKRRQYELEQARQTDAEAETAPPAKSAEPEHPETGDE